MNADPNIRAYYLAPFAALAIWFFALWRTTGHIFGDPGFTHYNIIYSLNPVRACVALLRRIYYLFIDDFRWAGSLAILFAWRRQAPPPHSRVENRLASSSRLTRFWSACSVAPPWNAICCPCSRWSISRWERRSNHCVRGALSGRRGPLGWASQWSISESAFPVSLRENLAMADFVELHRNAAQFLEKSYPAKTIYTAWPLTQALRDPAFGYVDRKLSAAETSDLHFLHAKRAASSGWSMCWCSIRGRGNQLGRAAMAGSSGFPAALL